MCPSQTKQGTKNHSKWKQQDSTDARSILIKLKAKRNFVYLRTIFKALDIFIKPVRCDLTGYYKKKLLSHEI